MTSGLSLRLGAIGATQSQNSLSNLQFLEPLFRDPSRRVDGDVVIKVLPDFFADDA